MPWPARGNVLVVVPPDSLSDNGFVLRSKETCIRERKERNGWIVRDGWVVGGSGEGRTERRKKKERRNSINKERRNKKWWRRVKFWGKEQRERTRQAGRRGGKACKILLAGQGWGCSSPSEKE